MAKTKRTVVRPVNPEVLKAAVRKLRVECGDSQQEFAQRLPSAIRSVARYETDRPPRGTVLIKLWRLAQQKKRADLAKIFRIAFWAELTDPEIQDALKAAIERSVQPGFERLSQDAANGITEDLTDRDLHEDEKRALETARGIIRTSTPAERQLFVESLQSIADFKRLLRRAELMLELEQRIAAETGQNPED